MAWLLYLYLETGIGDLHAGCYMPSLQREKAKPLARPLRHVTRLVLQGPNQPESVPG